MNILKGRKGNIIDVKMKEKKKKSGWADDGMQIIKNIKIIK